jgi:hypothetical protein
MTRKRSTYRPKRNLVNPLGWVLEGFKPITGYSAINVNTRIHNHEALRSVADGSATPYHLDVLINMSNMAMALSRVYGVDWKEELVAGANAIEAVQKRLYKWGKVQATPTELEAITFLTHIHDVQLDASRVKDIEAAHAIAKHGAVFLSYMEK